MAVKRERWHPPLYTKEQHRAVQALHSYGEETDKVFTPAQARDVIANFHSACGTYDDTFVQGQPDTTLILEGRRSVGLHWVKLRAMKINLGVQKSE
jgi:hypothetical protein